MLRSKRTVLILLALVLTGLAFASSFTPTASACYPYGVYKYYSSSSYINQVGTMTVSCTCKITVTGTKTSYVKYTAYNCSEPL
jgi:hypothetical protein